ncbi:MAG: PhnD/SsuA/transferrin family substrate-binding protein [Granulosicoccaceae bacterium]
MKHQIKGICVGLLTLALSNSVFAEEAIRLNFGVYSSNKPSAMVKIFKPTLKELESRMSAKLGREVDIRMQIAKDYEQGISHLTSGKVDFSRFGPASYLEAKRMNSDIKIAAMESKNSSKVFYGVIAVHTDSDIQQPSELKHRSFAFGDEGSTIGRFLSQRFLQENNILAEDLSNFEYLGRHDKVGTAVGAGDFDAGALNERTFKKLVDKGEQIRELVRFPNVTKPWIARSGLDPIVFTALKQSLLELKNPDALKGLKADGFLEGTDSDYAQIRAAMENNYMFFEERERHSTMSKAATVAEPASNLSAIASTTIGATATAATPSMESPEVTPTYIAPNFKQANGKSITINITLPSSVLSDQQTAGTGPQHLTINLVIPEVAAGVQEALKSADAGEL